MTGLRRAAGGWGPAEIRQISRMQGASCSGGDDGSMARGASPSASPSRLELGRWAHCAAGVRPDLSNLG